MGDWQPIPKHVKSLSHVECVVMRGYEILFAEEGEGIFFKVVSQGHYFSFSLTREDTRISACQVSVTEGLGGTELPVPATCVPQSLL